MSSLWVVRWEVTKNCFFFGGNLSISSDGCSVYIYKTLFKVPILTQLLPVSELVRTDLNPVELFCFDIHTLAHTDRTHLCTQTHTPSLVPYLLRDLVNVEELEML